LNAFGAGLRIIGSGSAAPSAILTNEDLSEWVETSDEWITSRTGIKERHLGAENDSLTGLSAQAAAQALEMAEIDPKDVDLIILATSTPDDLFGTAGRIQHQLGATQAVAFDLTAACSGFVFALITASQFIATGTYQTVVVIGGDVLSRWVDWSDRTTCVLFGDGAGAVVCQASEDNQLLGHGMYSDGSLHHCLNLGYMGESVLLKEGVTVKKGTFHPITMNGREVYRFAVARVPEVVEKALFQAKLTTEDIDWLILHQANQRIMDAVAERLSIPSEKVISNLSKYGNTSAASIPLALNEAVREGKIKKGDIIAASGFGAGLSWGSAVFRWG
jgi:3-oxoacyl-[acyl-carrier-protein] synthase-3